ncbi:class I SAM-dependent methyltransferase [Sphaerisporangium sp. TRM90804]|uniref:class I SAM-dependent methyltransferase n=1 Tax=Sphaerisporangium sp. TRM90804 TaxID=3031113 RepID=UPI002447BCA4|nr:class I SAM-dependent methyltransferase [Sphaerisporangium sp. TRM90804]MDH2428945.1 class I SAM-dependent methyltransferase [Sphaerisporangium sp. TRM90804]
MEDLSPIYRNAEIYDALYEGRDRTYEADSQRLVEYVKERNPSASSLLDVCCGTGRNLRSFADGFEHVEGVDLSGDMLEVARKRLPDVPLHQGDMKDFSLDRRFDAVTCLFSSIGYLEDPGQLNAALRCFGRHLNPGGVIVVEPWWFPENALSGTVMGDVVKVDGRTIARLSHTVVVGRAHRMSAQYLVADADSGIRHFTDLHMLSLFTRQEYEAAFAEAGVTSVDFIETGRDRPGLLVGVKS